MKNHIHTRKSTMTFPTNRLLKCAPQVKYFQFIVETLSDGTHLAEINRVQVLKTSETEFRATVWDLPKLSSQLCRFTIRVGSLVDIQCNCLHTDLKTWCVHKVASLIHMIRSPEQVTEFDDMKTKINDLTPDDLKKLLLNRVYTDPSFMESMTTLDPLEIEEIVPVGNVELKVEPVIEYMPFIRDLNNTLKLSRVHGTFENRMTETLDIVGKLFVQKSYSSALDLLGTLTGFVLVEMKELRVGRPHLPKLYDTWFLFLMDTDLPYEIRIQYVELLKSFHDSTVNRGESSKYMILANLVSSDWNEDWLVNLFDEQEVHLDDIDEDVMTLLIRARVLKSRRKSFVPLLNVVLRKVSIMSDDDLLDQPDLSEIMKELSVLHAAMLKFLISLILNLQNADEYIEKLIDLLDGSHEQRNTLLVRSLVDISIDALVLKCEKATAQEFVDVFLRLPTEDIQARFLFSASIQKVMNYADDAFMVTQILDMSNEFRALSNFYLSHKTESARRTAGKRRAVLDFTWDSRGPHEIMKHLLGDGPEFVHTLPTQVGIIEFTYFRLVALEMYLELFKYMLRVQLKNGLVGELKDLLGKCISTVDHDQICDALKDFQIRLLIGNPVRIDQEFCAVLIQVLEPYPEFTESILKIGYRIYARFESVVDLYENAVEIGRKEHNTWHGPFNPTIFSHYHSSIYLQTTLPKLLLNLIVKNSKNKGDDIEAFCSSMGGDVVFEAVKLTEELGLLSRRPAIIENLMNSGHVKDYSALLQYTREVEDQEDKAMILHHALRKEFTQSGFEELVSLDPDYSKTEFIKDLISKDAKIPETEVLFYLKLLMTHKLYKEVQNAITVENLGSYLGYHRKYGRWGIKVSQITPTPECLVLVLNMAIAQGMEHDQIISFFKDLMTDGVAFDARPSLRHPPKNDDEDEDAPEEADYKYGDDIRKAKPTIPTILLPSNPLHVHILAVLSHQNKDIMKNVGFLYLNVLTMQYASVCTSFVLKTYKSFTEWSFMVRKRFLTNGMDKEWEDLYKSFWPIVRCKRKLAEMLEKRIGPPKLDPPRQKKVKNPVVVVDPNATPVTDPNAPPTTQPTTTQTVQPTAPTTAPTTAPQQTYNDSSSDEDDFIDDESDF